MTPESQPTPETIFAADLDEGPAWLTAPDPDPVIGPTELALAGEALGGLLGDAAADVDLEALASELLAGDQPGGRVRYATREELVGHLVNAAVQRHRQAELEQADARPLGEAEAAVLEGLVEGGSHEAAKLAAKRSGAAGRKQLQFRSAAELMAELPPAIDWAWQGYLAFGAITELVGRAKAAGKTTLLVSLTRAIVDGDPFLGHPTTATPVVILSEQPPASLRAALERAGLEERDDVRLLLWRDARAIAWRDVVAGALEECARAGARVLVIDTLPAFAGIRGDAENDAGAALAAIEPLQLAAATNDLAIVVVRHERKGGGEVGDSGRGSSAFTGAVDVVMRLGRHAGPGDVPLARPTMRALSVLSRFDETPAEVLIELTDDGYVSLGTETAVVYGEVREQLLATLPEAPGPGLTVPELAAVIGGRRSTIQAALRELLDTGRAMRSGSGKRGDPHRFCREPLAPLAETPGIRAAGASPLRGRGSSRQQLTKPSRPASVSDRMGDIFEPEDVDEPDDMGPLLAELFPEFPGAEASA